MFQTYQWQQIVYYAVDSSGTEAKFGAWPSQVRLGLAWHLKTMRLCCVVNV